MTLPKVIFDYLRSEFLAQRRPLCFLVDTDFRLKRSWGQVEFFGFDGIEPGDDLIEYAPYLFGKSESKATVFPMIATADGHIFDVHIVPDAEQYYIVLLDMRHEHGLAQAEHQMTNDFRLLHANQQKLISRQRALIGELVEAKTELDHRRREAERNYESKSQFIAMMSHEFRTPLSSIINYADLATDDGASESDIRKSAAAIARASRHLGSLVDTVLDQARLEAGHVQLNELPFDIRSLVDDMTTIMAPLAAEKGLAFSASVSDAVPRHIRSDEMCLRQILINLLGNAVKYTEEGSVKLNVDWSNDELNATVVDTGPGIDIVDQERIFRAFERGTDAKKFQPGTGLGLAISIDLARLMRGHMGLESEKGFGSKIILSVPAEIANWKDPQEAALVPPAEAFHASRPTSILLCDDDEDMLAISEYYLHRAGYGLLLARDGLEAVEKALAYNPDLILMDINTPRLSGSDAAERLREAGFDNPIVALTASDPRQIDHSCFTAGLQKPIKMGELLSQIKRHMR